ncbi:hypothetical protein HMPREF1982_00081 [Clostridiales bacterium oral taxon 876 str. F0540]|nr:hypothetical protein HMPREF1982_00081 [Clostridiales bacterium oral taxon 876 str. F0540]
MRYVIVCLIKGEALEYHEKLVSDICKRFNVKRQRLPAHFTIKAPFESDDIQEIEKITEEFCHNNRPTSIVISNFGFFRESVIFMDIKASKECIAVNKHYIDLLKTVSGLEWKRNEGGNKVFHCTLVTKLFPDKFHSIWNYVSNFECNFKTEFDNISILKWDKDRWVNFKEYTFKDRL